MRVLELGSFDMILGEDWLDNHSPMWAHWRLKKMRFTHEGRQILLQGLKPESVACRAISSRKLQGLLRRKSVTHVVQLQKLDQSISMVHGIDTPPDPTTAATPPVIQAVLDRFPQAFEDITTLPPHRLVTTKLTLSQGLNL